jgi:hypothetical protein
MNCEDKKLTVEQAYRAMLVFLENEYQLTKSNDLGGLLGGYQFAEPGKTMDPAAWYDWEEAVDQVLNGPSRL